MNIKHDTFSRNNKSSVYTLLPFFPIVDINQDSSVCSKVVRRKYFMITARFYKGPTGPWTILKIPSFGVSDCALTVRSIKRDLLFPRRWNLVARSRGELKMRPSYWRRLFTSGASAWERKRAALFLRGQTRNWIFQALSLARHCRGSY